MENTSNDATTQAATGKRSVVSDGVLKLRPLRLSDVGADYVGWVNDPEVVRYLEIRFQSHTADDVRAFVEAVNARPNEFIYAMEVVSAARHIGNIKVGPIHPVHGCADVSLFIGDRGWHGRGMATRALHLVQQVAFEHLGVRKLCAGVYVQNTASLKAFDKAGFRREGLRVGQYTLDGVAIDLVEFGLLAHEWPGLRAARSSVES
jgi:ribosomal-protein-alanine N-acetyltransferase